MPEIEEMAKWAAENASPAGRTAIQEHFGVSEWQAREIAQRAAHLLRKEPIEVTPPALSTLRKFDPVDPAFRAPTVQKLRKTRMSLNELAAFLGTDESQAQDMVRSLKGAGYLVEEAEGQFSIGKLRPDTAIQMGDYSRLVAQQYTFATLADSHLVSQHQRLDVLEFCFEECKRRGIKDVYLIGNMIDGYRERINGGEVFFRNLTDQCMYAADHWPGRPGVTTRFVTADCHEGWFAKKVGINVGYHLEDCFQRAGRQDVQYVGHMERDFVLKSPKGDARAILRLFHPSGGSSYAISYKPQKFVESYQGGQKPAILLIGHFHKMGSFYIRNVNCLLTGCAQDQTRWMRSKGIEAHVGFYIVTIEQDKKGGISRFVVERIPFFDQEYHLDSGEWESALYQGLGK